ncbi:segment polarity protein dishevelled homolog DVL-3-like isoform X2 [Styela clava]|uniref:segment polarity protein dishevelled homolog DVL-3-like isoform X2 n=1 Tax=Styela clava TaxID=7725 RepID=UPI00193AA6D7|nr:segment polarity protein dishevelled homolog DVL-3-like isoform X2 [Styela clava]
MPEETKIVYYIGDEATPYLSKVTIPPEQITLGNFKVAINKPNYKYFFRSTDADFGVVKEEITNDDSKLPVSDNKVVAWLVAPDNDTASICSGMVPTPQERMAGIGDSRPSSFHPNAMGSTDVDTDSMISNHKPVRPGMQRVRNYDKYGSQSTLLTTTTEDSMFDSSDETRYSTTCSESTMSSRRKHRQKVRKKRRPRPESDTTSNYSSSITDSSMSLNILTVTLNMDKYTFLGISIVGQSNDKGDGGIYIGSIMKGGAVAADGRVEPGDMLLQVNDKNFENMSNDDAVRVLRDIVHKPGPITLTVAKCWDPNPNYFTVPKYEPVQPIDPAAWVNHTAVVTGGFQGPSPAISSNLTETSSDTMASSLPESERYDQMPLSIHSAMTSVVRTLKTPNSGLDIKTRMWLKITIPDAFIGSDLVEWLSQNVEGLQDRKDARQYASNLLKAGYIRHTVNKTKFSEQCYYVFGEYNGAQIHKDIGNLSLGDSNSEHGSDMLGPLPSSGSWPNVHGGHPYPTFNNMQYNNPYHPDGGPKQDFPVAGNHPPPPLYGGSVHSDVDTLSIHSGSTYSGMPMVPVAGPYNSMPHANHHRLSGDSGSDRASSRHSGRSGNRRDSPAGGNSDRLSDRGSDRTTHSQHTLQSQRPTT